MTIFSAKMINPHHPLACKSYYDIEQKRLCTFIYAKTSGEVRPDGDNTPPQDMYRKYFRVGGEWINSNKYAGEPHCTSWWGIAGIEDQLQREIIILIKDKDRWELIDAVT